MPTKTIHTLILCSLTGIALISTQTASQAQFAPPVLVFTEESSTVLTATISGVGFGSVTLNSPDHWTWVLPADRPAVNVIVTSTVDWVEPESTSTKTLGNYLSPSFSPGGLGVVSDFDFTGFLHTPIPNDSVAPDSFSFHYTDGTSETFRVQFNDLGDVASNVPDNSSTLVMLALSAATMFGFVRFRQARA